MNPFDLTGPQFLLVYIIFAGLVIAGLVFARRHAELSPSTPRIDLSDPYLIAFLRGGEKEVLRVATVTLIQRGLLVRDGKQIQRAENASPNSVRIPVEQALLNKYARSGKVSWMFEDDGLSLACEPYARTLQRARLLPDDYVHRGRLVRLVIATFLLTGVGFTKVMIALDAGRTNVGFLIVLIIASLIIAAAISFPRLTESGKAMIFDVQSLYGGLRHRASPINAGPASAAQVGSAGVEPMMLAAVFGVGALAGSGFSFAEGLFRGQDKRRSNSCASDNDCGSSCSTSSGSSCSSTSSSSCSSGSSSCSGGSSCGGGGCGGCGG